jgi:hypothetical protein
MLLVGFGNTSESVRKQSCFADVMRLFTHRFVFYRFAMHSPEFRDVRARYSQPAIRAVLPGQVWCSSLFLIGKFFVTRWIASLFFK